MTAFTRRTVLAALPAVAALVATTRSSYAQQSDISAGGEPFTLPPLPYLTTVLEPHIDAKTMELHHDKHHAAYVNNLNAAAKQSPEFAKQPVQDVLANLNSVPESIRMTVRNNLGGHVNHSMFWQVMGANGGKPSGDVLAAIQRDFGGLEKLQADFNTAGGKVFGSGWVFITVTTDGSLAMETRPNQDTPLMEGKRVLFGNDVWEHAYYLNYQNRRPDYLEAWWNVVNWTKIAERYELAKKGMLAI